MRFSHLLVSASAVGSTLALPFSNFNFFGKRQLTTPAPKWTLDDDPLRDVTDYDPKTWKLSTTVFMPNHYQMQPYVANGYHGARLTAEGFGFWIERNETNPEGHQPVNGWPLDNERQTFATISGFWNSQHNTTRTNFPELLDKGGESVISGIPIWTSLVVTTLDGHSYLPGVTNTTVSKYRQSLSLKSGVVETSLRWTPNAKDRSRFLDLKYTIYAHRARVNLGAVKLEVSSSTGEKVWIADILDGRGAQRTQFHESKFDQNDVIWTAVKPNWIHDVTAFEYSAVDIDGGRVVGNRRNPEGSEYVSDAPSTVAQEWQVDTAKGKVAVEKYVGIASSDAFPKNTFTVAKTAAEKAKKDGWKKVMKEHEAAWQDLWEEGDVEVPKDEELQIAFRASLFHLLSNVRSLPEGTGLNDNSITVGGLTSDSYAGFVFWDADLWMYPGLLALFPDHAAVINEYRYRLLPQALENAESYGHEGALYPWTSGRFGNCTATGPCVDYQYHLNSDIAHSQWNYFLSTGDEKWLKERGWPIINAVAEMWASVVVKNGSTNGQYWIFNMTDPDEYTNHVNNGAFTIASTIVTLGFAERAAEIVGAEIPPKWKDVRENMAVPYDIGANIVPEFSGMNGSVEIKQADVVLINYPLEFRYNETQAMNDLDFYARAQSPDGPAMTWAIFAISSAELSTTGCSSYTYTLYASQPYARQPYFQFSEQIDDNFFTNGGTNPAFIFLTGHGGFLQVATHGFTGHRLREDAFYLDPNLPPQLAEGGIKVKGMKYRGGVFDVEIGGETTTITRRGGPKHAHGVLEDPITVRISQNNTMAGDYPLIPGQSLEVPTRRPDLKPPVLDGNIAQCRPVSSKDSYVSGNYPLAAVDGSNATTWRPTSVPASLDIDLGEERAFRGLHINWGPVPAETFKLYTTSLQATSNSTDLEAWDIVAKYEGVSITEPWSEEDALVVKLRMGNTTAFELPEEQPSFRGRWVKLVIDGSLNEGEMPTVAEVGVIGE